ncbi:hypothetical protein FR932_17165 [Moritella marina ATCC 15381]|uniref:Uncharacterized protein n=1 Tax=Moritella marina ATCC 15381 TaxID=1202962 RepID=A0A5J6WPX5_MORMI|nr:hypothetical protein [Moritella marina]QFI39444.1 hypothetical protein FR932_17165 [Moritella marina ATCC 15381]
MNKSLLATIVSASLFLAGCSSSGDSSNGGPGDPVIPDIDGSPEWGLDIEAVIPDLDDSPEWGLDAGNTPDWGVVDPDFGLPTASIPDRLPPIWGGPEMPEIDNSPTISHTISGSTIMSADMVQDGPRPLMESSGQVIDRSAIRDSIRSHLK